MSETMKAHLEELRLLTVEQFAERANLGRTTAYAMVASGEVASVKIGRLRRIPVQALDDYIARLLESQAAA